MRARLIGDESYDVPPRLGSGVLVGIKGVIHVVRNNHGIRVRMFCAEQVMPEEMQWSQHKTLEQGWYEAPTCVRCASHPGAIKARYHEMLWREEWWQRPGNQASAPREVEPAEVRVTSADIKKYLTTDKYIQSRTCAFPGYADPKKWKRVAKYKAGSKTDLEGADIAAHSGLCIGKDFPRYRGCWVHEFILEGSDGGACFLLIEKDGKIVAALDYSD